MAKPNRLARLMRQTGEAAAAGLPEYLQDGSGWAPPDSAMSFTSAQPMLTMGSAKAASQTYNAGALFTSANAVSKG